MKSFKITASKIKNPRFFLKRSPDVILNEPPPGGTRRGAVYPAPHPSYAPDPRESVWTVKMKIFLKIPELKPKNTEFKEK